MASETLNRLHTQAHKRGQDYERRQAAWARYRTYAREVAEGLPFAWAAVGCDNPTQNGSGYTNGQDHIVLKAPLHFGRLHRTAGDALCRPAHRFHGNLWGESDGPTCKRCLEIAEGFSSISIIAKALHLVSASEAASEARRAAG